MECELCKSSKEPCGFFSKGIIVGLLSRIVNEEVEVHELMCIAKGDPYCLFRAGPRGKFKNLSIPLLPYSPWYRL